MKKRGENALSPTIATVILIGIILVIAIIVFIWLTNLKLEIYQKKGEDTNNVCKRLVFGVSYNSGTLTLSNKGNDPIVDFVVKKETTGSSTSFKLSKNGFSGLPKGSNSDVDITGDVAGISKINVIPVLLSQDNNGAAVQYKCEDSIGKELDI